MGDVLGGGGGAGLLSPPRCTYFLPEPMAATKRTGPRTGGDEVSSRLQAMEEERDTAVSEAKHLRGELDYLHVRVGAPAWSPPPGVSYAAHDAVSTLSSHGRSYGRSVPLYW